MSVKKRCGFCLNVVREDGTCQEPDCPRYVPDKTETTDTTETTTTTDNGGK